MKSKILHISPHADDEMIGAPGILIDLEKEGHRVDNFLCSLGKTRPEERRAEAEEAARRARFSLILSRGEGDLALQIKEMVAKYDIIISPSLQDGHPWHEEVARLVRDALQGVARGKLGPIWWQWGIWNELSIPSLLYPYGKDTMHQVFYCLKAYRGELQRNNYKRLVKGRSMANSVLGPERCFGFGREGIDQPYADIVGEVIYKDGWHLCHSRILNVENPFFDISPKTDITSWVESF